MGPIPKGLLIWGGGGHGKVVADLVRVLGLRVIGFVDADPAKLGADVEPGGGCVVAMEDHLLSAGAAGGQLPHQADGVVFAIGNNRRRDQCLRRLPNTPSPPLVHPGALVSSLAEFGRGTVIFAGCVVNAAARIGKGVILNSGCVVEHDCVVEDAAHISPGAVLAGGVRVGARSWVGAGAVIIPRVCIGADAVVGAGAVILHDIPAGATVVGNPGRVIRSRRTPATEADGEQ